ncbi:MAG TPA: hypothetical protein VJH94_03430 [Candidatus Paceibacterota bacterium]
MPDSEPKAFGGTDSNRLDPLTEGLYVAGISKEQLQLYGAFYNDLYQKVRDKYRPRQVTRNALTMLQGAIFALGTQKLNNPEWQEHCASSLREILHEWNGSGKFENDYKEFYPDGWRDEDSATFRELRLHYQYFSGIDHHEASGVLGSLIALLNDSTLKIEDCYKTDIFIIRVQKFLQNTSDIVEFSKRKGR